MTAFKKYLKKKGIKFEEDYYFIPYPVYGGVLLEEVTCVPEKAEVIFVYTSIILKYRLERDGQLVDVEEDNNPPFFS